MDKKVDQNLVQISRRGFLKGLGLGSAAVSLNACAKDSSEKIFPYNKGEPEQIPGVAVWYNSTCTECSAGCGIQVRTREGRAVKIEGNKLSPINEGGLCALGQSALQSLYNPDRVRQPLQKVSGPDGKPRYEPISWDDALAKISEALGNETLERAFITDELGGGALSELVGDWSKALKAEHVTFDFLQPTALAKASKLVYGIDGVPQFNFDQADYILNFGADFLETWISPCEFARGWARSRRRDKPVRVVHIEPRASLTAANADEWLASKPGTEVTIALALIRAVLDRGKVANLDGGEFGKLRQLTASYDLTRAANESGISVESLTKVAENLVTSKSPLVLAGGTLGMSDRALPLAVAAQLLNLALSAVGKTVDVTRPRRVTSSTEALQNLVKRMADKKVGVLFVHQANPSYALPSDFNFDYAVRYIPLVVSFSSQIDETSRHAHLILPANTGLESWGDLNPVPGVYSLVQPTMTPVFDTRELGELLMSVAQGAGKKLSLEGADTGSFLNVLKGRWKKFHGKHGAGRTFDQFWNECVERGGLFINDSKEGQLAGSLSPDIFNLNFADKPFAAKGAEDSEVVLFPFTSVKTFDGRAANRPWLQELPDPMSQIMWDGWAEVHPDTAKKYNLEHKDLVSVRNHFGEITVPVFVTAHIHRGIVAVPMGHGHTNFGRFAAQTEESGNVLDLLPSTLSDDGGGVALLSTKVNLVRARGRATVLQQMGTDSQHNRELARTRFISSTGGAVSAVTAAGASHVDPHAEQEGHQPSVDAHGEAHGDSRETGLHGHHDAKQFYHQREHPLYRWGMAIDLTTCTGCAACVVACYAENNIPVVGKEAVSKGREMSWLRIERYHDGGANELQVSFLPMLCQHCGNAPCEPVCPVFATYHNEEGLNAMIYNRCVGTRYCSNNCSYKVRRFNWHEFDFPEPMQLQLNPDVTKRTSGVMEKCTFCVQRINEAKDSAKDLGRFVKDGEIQPACVQGCPSECLVFGNLNDPESKVSKLASGANAYKVLDHHLNTQPAISYLERVRYEK